MGRVERFQNVAAEDLPDVWRARLGIGANERVNIRVEAVPTDEEIVGYDEFGLPT